MDWKFFFMKEKIIYEKRKRWKIFFERELLAKNIFYLHITLSKCKGYDRLQEANVKVQEALAFTKKCI